MFHQTIHPQPAKAYPTHIEALWELHGSVEQSLQAITAAVNTLQEQRKQLLQQRRQLRSLLVKAGEQIKEEPELPIEPHHGILR